MHFTLKADNSPKARGFSLKSRLIFMFCIILGSVIIVSYASFFQSIKAIIVKQTENKLLSQIKPIVNKKNLSLKDAEKYLKHNHILFVIADLKFNTIANSSEQFSFTKKDMISEKTLKKNKLIYISKYKTKKILVILMPLKTKNGRYIIKIASYIKDYDSIINNYAHFIFLSGLITFLIAVIVWFLIVHYLFTDFEEIISMLNGVIKGNFSMKSKLFNRSDEMGIIARKIKKAAKNHELSLKSQNRFGASIAHEIRTPVSVLKGSTEVLMKSAYKNPDDILKLSANMLSEINRLNHLCDRLLEIAKLENIPTIKKDDIDIKELLNECVSDMKIVAGTRRIILKGGLRITVSADRNMIRQVVLNLIDNSVKNTSENGIIEIDWKLAKNGVYISIKDNGTGIKEKDMPLIFEPFYKADKNKKGAGLGLAFCKSVIESHGGYIYAESTKQSGTTFTFFLPFEQ